MFNIALALVLSGDYDGQTVFFAKPVRSAADIVIAPLVGMVVPVIRKADRIENQVIMNMIFVYVGGKYKFILAAQDFFCKLHADLMGLLRRDLPRLKGLDQVAAQVRSLVDGMATGPGKFDIRSFGGAAIGRNKQLSIGLFRVTDDSMVRVSKLIEQLSSSGVIVFVVSHDFEFIVRTCTEVVQLDDDGAIQNQRLSPEILKTLSEKYFT